MLMNRGETLKCTLWEDFALQFQNYNSQRTDWGHTIIVIHNGKIKEATGYYSCFYIMYILFEHSFFKVTFKLVLHSCLFLEKYELGVSNAWNATKLFINDDIPPINEFKVAKGDTLPFVCPDGHETHAINMRFHFLMYLYCTN
jgi:hypothetical protein